MDISLFFTSRGPGGLIALAAFLTVLISYTGLIGWIARGNQEEKEPWEQMDWPFK